MIIMISIVDAIGKEFISPGTVSDIWQNDFPSHPFFSLALWHLLLLTIVFMMYHESRYGFRKTKNIFGKFLHWFLRNKKKSDINYSISRYKEKSKKVYLSNALIVVVLAVFIAFILNAKIIFFTLVISDSMNPLIEKGDIVLMHKIYAKPEIGDIINFKAPDIDLPVTHRIISISGNQMRTRGDSNPNEDPWMITNASIIGKIVTVSGKPVIIKNLGEYLLIDASKGGRTYGPEFNAVSNLIKGIKFTGFVIFTICMLLYLAFSFRDSRRIKW